MFCDLTEAGLGGAHSPDGVAGAESVLFNGDGATWAVSAGVGRTDDDVPVSLLFCFLEDILKFDTGLEVIWPNITGLFD